MHKRLRFPYNFSIYVCNFQPPKLGSTHFAQPHLYTITI